MIYKQLLKRILQGNKTEALAACARHLVHEPMDVDCQRLLKQAIALPNTSKTLKLDDSTMEIIQLFEAICMGTFHDALKQLLGNIKKGDIRRLTWLKWANGEPQEEDWPMLSALPHWLLQTHHRMDEPTRQEILETLVGAYIPTYYPDQPDWIVACIIIARLNGQVDQAMRWARDLHKREPHNDIALLEAARVHRDGAKYDDAQGYYKTLIELAPNTTKTARIELAQLSAQCGQLQQSLALYQSVVDSDPEHPVARPMSYFLRCFLTGDLIWKTKLEEYARARPFDQHSKHLLNRLERRFTAYLGFWPEPGDSLIQLMNQLRPEHLKSNAIPPGIRLKMLDAPSARRTFERFLNHHQTQPHPFDIQVDAIQEPDPRVPTGLVEHLLWSYKDETVPIPNYPPAQSHIETHIIDLATQPFDITEWMQTGQRIAKHLGVDSRDDLFGVMLHPPESPKDTTPIGQPMTPWRWVQRIQVAAMCVLAQLDQGWHRSHRKAILTSMLLGPTDWVVEAAIVVATEIALTDESSTADITGLFERRLKTLPQNGYCCFEYALISQMIRLPNLDDEVHTYLVKWLAIFEQHPVA